MSHPIYDAINAVLTADQTTGSLYDDVGGRIRENQLNRDEQLPAIRYAIITDPFRASFKQDRLEAEVQFDVYGDPDTAMTDVHAINAKLISLLKRTAITITGYSGGQAWPLDRGRLFKEPDVNRIMSRYRIWGNTSG